ncbi:MAG: hypothetical protein V1926_01245 [Candidatus Peregrinibacteria bacterium]
MGLALTASTLVVRIIPCRSWYGSNTGIADLAPHNTFCRIFFGVGPHNEYFHSITNPTVALLVIFLASFGISLCVLILGRLFSFFARNNGNGGKEMKTAKVHILSWLRWGLGSVALSTALLLYDMFFDRCVDDCPLSVLDHILRLSTYPIASIIIRISKIEDNWLLLVFPIYFFLFGIFLNWTYHIIRKVILKLFVKQSSS